MKTDFGSGMKHINHKIDLYNDEILNKNYKNFKSFAFGGMILTGLITLAACIFFGHVYFTREYAMLFLVFVLCNLYIHYFLKNHIKYTLCSFYIAIAPMLMIGILMGTFLDSESNAMTIMIMLCTFFMFISDKPQHIIGYIVGTSFVFLFCSYSCKPTTLFVSDAVNLVIYLSVGISVNMLTLKDRVESAENYSLAMRRANSDALTLIFNRGAGESIVKEMLDRGQKGSFIIADIDDFKHINDSYGHQIGDEVIRGVSKQLKNVFRDEDVVWRLGGDEFAVFAVNLLSKELCEERLKKLQECVAKIKVADTELQDVKLSIGCCICLKDCDFDTVYKHSDDALYEVKHKGKNGYFITED